MRIVADENMPLVEAFFGHLGEVVRLPGRELNRSQLANTDILLVRSVTQVDAELLSGTPVQFVGSATIGTDHIDQTFLNQQGVCFSSAPGCNAESVVDYVLSALVNLARLEDVDLWSRKVGIVGVGNVGGRLQKRLTQLGIDCLLCDPPRAEREGQAGFVALDELIEGCDTLCLHTPLTERGPHPTKHLLDEARLERLAAGGWLLNAGRGPVIDNQALLNSLNQRADLQVVLDVWEPEPEINRELARRVRYGTAHIAGYSLEGKSRGPRLSIKPLAGT